MISPRRDGTTGGGSGGGGGTTTPTGKLYVTNQSGSAILRFDNAFTATGNATPAATISGASTSLASPQFITLDSQADRLYVAENSGGILIFDSISTKSANVSPTRTISGPATNLVSPTDVALDKGRDLLYVVDGTDVVVFSPASTVNSNAPPVRIITPNPAFNIGGIFIDAANDRMFLSDPTIGANAIKVFDSASTLNSIVAPARAINGAGTQLGQPGSLFVDSSGRLFVSNFSPARITIYPSAATANGNLSPTNTITSPDMSGPNQITLNSTNGDLYVADTFGPKVLVFANATTINGSVAATRNINGPNTSFGPGGGIPGPRGVALDTTR